MLQLLKFEPSRAPAPRQGKPLQPGPSTASKREKGDGTHGSSVNAINVKIKFLTVRKAVYK